METCLEKINSPVQDRQDIVRRSAGLPFAILSLFLQEVRLNSCRDDGLIQRGMKTLMEVATSQNHSQNCDGINSSRTGDDEYRAIRAAAPRIHVFNIFRRIFGNRDLGNKLSSIFVYIKVLSSSHFSVFY